MANPTKARFGDIERNFSTSKEGYIFLLDRFLQAQPRLLDQPIAEEFVVHKTGARRFFARSQKELFEASPHLAEDPNMSAKISGGWYANVNLSDLEKWDLLARLAAMGNWKWEADWFWETPEIQRRNAATASLLDDF